MVEWFDKLQGMKRLLLILWLTEFVKGAFLLSFLPAYGVERLGFGVWVTGLAISAHYLTDTIFKVCLGWLLDKLPVRPILTGGLVLGLLSLYVMDKAASAAVLIAGATLYGFGVSAVWLILFKRVTARKEERGTLMGLIFTVWLVGFGLGAVSINFLMGIGYETAFSAMFAVWALSAVLSLWIPVGIHETLGERTEPADFVRSIVKQVKTVRLLVPGMLLQTMSAGFLVPVVKLIAQRHFGLSSQEYGLMLVFAGVVVIVSLVPSGRLSDRFGPKLFLMSGFLLAGFSLGMVSAFWKSAWFHAGWAVYGVAALLGLAYALILPSWNAVLARALPQHGNHGTGWGVFASLEGIGATVGPAVGGWAARWFGLLGPVYAAVAVFFFMAAFYFYYPLEKAYAAAEMEKSVF
jgi:MFS family permease